MWRWIWRSWIRGKYLSLPKSDVKCDEFQLCRLKKASQIYFLWVTLMYIKFLKVNWELRTWILRRIVCISRNWKNFFKKIYTYILRWFLFMSLHTAQTQCTLYTVIILYTVLEHILLRCSTLNSKIYMTTMNNESYCCVLISLSMKEVWWSTIKNYWQKNKMQYVTYCFSALIWWWIVMFFVLGHHSRSHDG